MVPRVGLCIFVWEWGWYAWMEALEDWEWIRFECEKWAVCAVRIWGVFRDREGFSSEAFVLLGNTASRSSSDFREFSTLEKPAPSFALGFDGLGASF